MNRKKDDIKLNYLDFVPVLSGLIGKIALVSSFALVWSQELSIKNPDFVLENVRIEILIGSIITLIAAILCPNVAPAGTLAPLVVLIPVMADVGVHPHILGISVGIIGIVVIKTGLFKRLVDLAGFVCKTSITFTFGLSGIWMSASKLYYFFKEKQVFWILLIVLIIIYIILVYYKKNWMMIPIGAFIAIIIPYFFGVFYELKPINLNMNLNPYYWWYDMWGIGFGFQLDRVIRTIPFAFVIILLWTIDTISIQTIREASYTNPDEIDDIDIEKSFQIASVRNIIGSVIGGAQTSSLWRSFLIPLYLVKRPMGICSVLLGVVGIIASLTALPIQIMSYTPIVWSVLLFGIFLPFTVTAIKNIRCEKKLKSKYFILLFTLLGVVISPILSWILSVIYDKFNE